MIKHEIEEFKKMNDLQVPSHTVNSFYNDQPPMKKPAGSSKFLGNFKVYSSWYIDHQTGKVVRSKL